MDISRKYVTDEQLEVAGVWRQDEDAEFLVARLGSTAYTRIYQRLLRDKGVVNAESLGDDETNELVVQAMAEAILLGWRGNVQWEGEALPYSIENAKKVLTVKDFRGKVFTWSREWERYRKHRVEEASKN